MVLKWFSKVYHPGDWVVYRKTKRSIRPGPRARHITPARCGEEYVYEVKKFYVVERVEPGHVIVRTRKGRRHRIAIRDPGLRRAHWWERFWFRHRFPIGTPEPRMESPQESSPENTRAAS